MCPFPEELCLKLLQDYIGGRELSDIGKEHNVDESVLRLCFETLGFSISAPSSIRGKQAQAIDQKTLLRKTFYSELNQLAASANMLKDSKACHLFARMLYYFSRQNRRVDGEISVLIKNSNVANQLLVTRGHSYVGDRDPMLSHWKKMAVRFQGRTWDLVRHELAGYMKCYGANSTREMLTMAIELGQVLSTVENGSIVIPFELGKPIVSKMVIKEYIG